MHYTVKDILGNPGTMLRQSAMPAMSMDCESLGTGMLIVHGLLAPGYYHADRC
jgi:hypothetical protein